MNNMATSLFMHGMIRTTKPKAKELRGVAERLITFAKRGDLHARRQVLRRIRNKVIVAKLFDEIAPTFAERQGGYTRVLSLGPRRGDATEVCIIELVGSELRSELADTVSSEGAAVSSPAVPAEVEVEETSEDVETPDATDDGSPVAESDSADSEEESDGVETAAEEPEPEEDKKT
jgi:large subunit ribosomal protein L17